MILSVSYSVSTGIADHCTLLNSLKTLKASWKELRATAGGSTTCMQHEMLIVMSSDPPVFH